MDQDRNSPQRRVGSVRQAAAILRYLETTGIGHGVNPIARALDISPSSCFNLLKTLTDEDLVDFDPATKLYSLGGGAIALGRRALDPRGCFDLVRQRLEALADKHQVTTSLWRPRRGDQMILLGYAESPAAYRIHLTVGQRLPSAAGANGRCFLAFSGLDDNGILRRMDAVKWAEEPDPKTFLAEIAATRERGWAVDEGQFIRGVTTISTPVLGKAGAEFMVTATLFNGQHASHRIEAIAEELGAAAKWLAARLFGT